MKKIPTVSFVFDRKHQSNSRKRGTIDLRIGYERKAKFISTGVHLLPKEWRNGMVTNRVDAIELNKSLDTLRINVQKVINDMMNEHAINLHEIPARLARLENDGKSFIDFCKERAAIRKYGRVEDSKERYNRFLRFLVSYGKIKYFADVTEKNILVLDEYLIKERKLKDNSKWSGYHRFLNSFIIDAISEGLMKRNPYRSLHIPTDKQSKSLHKYLTIEELHRFESADMRTESLNRVRDLFIFQTYTCLSYVDMAAFDFTKVKNDDGNLIYTGRRGKTHQEFTFLILKPAMNVLQKYDYKLPILSNVKYNEYLKVCAQMAQIDKPISSHWARHTGATILLNEGVDMEIVAKVLGHSSTKITRTVYAKLLDKTIEKKMAEVNKRISNPNNN